MGIVKKYLESHPFCKFTDEKLAAELGIPLLQVKKEMLFALADACPYSVAETAIVFEISKGAARKLIQSLPTARKIGGCWLACARDVQAAYKSQNPPLADVPPTDDELDDLYEVAMALYEQSIFNEKNEPPEPSSIGGCGARNWFAD